VLSVQSWNHFFARISLERILQVQSGEDRKSRSGDCFFVLATLILHRFDLALHAYFMIFFPYSIFKKKKKKKKNKKKIWGRNCMKLYFSYLGMSDIACIFA
jgi:hypothetical protein